MQWLHIRSLLSLPAQRAIDCEKAARWTLLTDAKGVRRAMARTEYILM